MGRLLDRLQLLTRAASVRDRGRSRPAIAAALVLGVAGAGYTVQSGDTLSSLATRFGVSVGAIADANDLADPDLIVVGQVLVIPGQDDAGGPSAPSGGTSAGDGGLGTTHVVASGESLASIASRYGLTVAQLAVANGIQDANRLLAGALLRIAGEAPPTPGVAGEAQQATHTVARGQTLSAIASRYDTSVTDLVAANDLADPDRIVVGQRLTVPGAATGPRWQCPVPDGEFINDFGVAKLDGRFHEGVDVFAPRGSLIHAPVGGTIEHVRGKRAGNQFTLHADDGYTYIGTHLESYGPSGRVEKGTPIGTVGTSGNARGTPPHLHLEMHHDGVVNPYPTLQQYC